MTDKDAKNLVEDQRVSELIKTEYPDVATSNLFLDAHEELHRRYQELLKTNPRPRFLFGKTPTFGSPEPVNPPVILIDSSGSMDSTFMVHDKPVVGADVSLPYMESKGAFQGGFGSPDPDDLIHMAIDYSGSVNDSMLREFVEEVGHLINIKTPNTIVNFGDGSEEPVKGPGYMFTTNTPPDLKRGTFTNDDMKKLLNKRVVITNYPNKGQYTGKLVGFRDGKFCLTQVGILHHIPGKEPGVTVPKGRGPGKGPARWYTTSNCDVTLDLNF